MKNRIRIFSLSLFIILDTRREKKSGKYPVKLRIVLNCIPKDYQTIFDLTQEDYNKFSAPRISSEMQEVRNSLQKLEKDAQQFASGMKPFSLEGFETQFVKSNRLIAEPVL